MNFPVYDNGPRVFVTQETLLNVAKAQRFGCPLFLLSKHMHITVSATSALEELRERLQDFSDNDFILPIGDPIAIALSINVAAEMNDGRVKVLKWDKEMRDYYCVPVDFYENETTEG